MQTIFLKKITVYISILSFVLCILTNIACKKNEQKKLDNTTETQLDEDTKKAISRIKIKDFPELSDKSDYSFKYSSANGKDEETLKENCYSFYSEYWKNQIKDEKEMDEADPSNDGLKKIKEIIKNPENDVKVKIIQDNIAIVNRTAFGIDGYLGLEKFDDVWIFDSEKWILLQACVVNLYREAKLLNLNNDEYLDAIVSGGCCDNRELNIFIGDKDKILSLRQNVNINGINELNYNDKCDINIIAKSDPEWAEEHKTKPITLKFDCNNNGFVLPGN